MYALNVSNSALLPIHYHCPGLNFTLRYLPGAHPSLRPPPGGGGGVHAEAASPLAAPLVVRPGAPADGSFQKDADPLRNAIKADCRVRAGASPPLGAADARVAHAECHQGAACGALSWPSLMHHLRVAARAECGPQDALCSSEVRSAPAAGGWLPPLPSPASPASRDAADALRWCLGDPRLRLQRRARVRARHRQPVGALGVRRGGGDGAGAGTHTPRRGGGARRVRGLARGGNEGPSPRADCPLAPSSGAACSRCIRPTDPWCGPRRSWCRPSRWTWAAAASLSTASTPRRCTCPSGRRTTTST